MPIIAVDLFHPPVFLRNGHVQTIPARIAPPGERCRVVFERERLES